MSHLTLVRDGTGAAGTGTAKNRIAGELRSSFLALKNAGCLEADKAAASWKARQHAFAELRGLINNGPADRRAMAIDAVAEVSKEGDLRAFVELAVPIMCSIDKEMCPEEKQAVTELLAAVAGAPDEIVSASGFEAGVRARLLGLTIRFQDFLFRNDFFLEAKTGLFESASRSLMKENPERALRILLNHLKELNYECEQLLSSRALVGDLEGNEMRSRAEWLDAATKMVEEMDDVSPHFAEAVKRDGDAFKTDVERRKKIAEEISRINPMARMVQLSSVIKLVGEAQAGLGMVDISEAREIRDALANARALMKELNA